MSSQEIECLVIVYDTSDRATVQVKPGYAYAEVSPNLICANGTPPLGVATYQFMGIYTSKEKVPNTKN